MMSKRRDVQLALKSLTIAALPLARVQGFDDEPVKAERPDPGGDVLGYPGEAGEPEVTLSPLTYHYDHEMVLEFAATTGAGLDSMMQDFGQVLAADRTLGGLADWAEAGMPDLNDRNTEGASGSVWARVPVTVSYSTKDPLN